MHMIEQQKIAASHNSRRRRGRPYYPFQSLAPAQPISDYNQSLPKCSCDDGGFDNHFSQARISVYKDEQDRTLHVGAKENTRETNQYENKAQIANQIKEMEMEKQLSKKCQKQIKENKSRVQIDYFNCLNDGESTTFDMIASEYDKHGEEISIEEMMKCHYKAFNSLLASAKRAHESTVKSTSSSDRYLLEIELREVEDSLLNFNPYRNPAMLKKVTAALSSMDSCRNHLMTQYDQQDQSVVMSLGIAENDMPSTSSRSITSRGQMHHCTNYKIGTIALKVLSLQRQARKEVRNILAELEVKIAGCRAQLEVLDIGTDDSYLSTRRQDVINLCHNTLASLNLPWAATSSI